MTDTFNPDEFLNQSAPAVSTDSIQQSQFDPDTYLNQKQLESYNKLQAKAGDIPHQGLAGIAGLARGASLGLSDELAVNTGITTPKQLSELKEANPITSGVSELLGGAGLIGATGGASTLGLSGIPAMAAEGAAFGAGQAISDHALGDPSLNAQKILAHIGTGAVLGTGLGLLGKSIEVVLPAATRKLTESLQKLKDYSIGSPEVPGIISKIAPKWSEQLYDGMISAGKDPQKLTRDISGTVEQIVKSGKQAASDLYEKAAKTNFDNSLYLTPVEEAQQAAKISINKIDKLIEPTYNNQGDFAGPFSSSQNSKLVNQAVQNWENKIASAGTSAEAHTVTDEFARKIDKLIKFDKVLTESQKQDQQLLWQIRNNIREDLKNPDLWGESAIHYDRISNAYKSYSNSYKNFKKDFMIKEVGPNGFSQSRVSPDKITNFFEKYNDNSQIIKKEHFNTFLDQVMKLGKESENHANFEQGSQSLSDHINSLVSKNEDMAKIASAMSNKVRPQDSGILNNIIAPSAVLKIGGLSNPAVAVGVASYKILKSITNPYELGNNLSNTLSKLKVVGNIINKVNNSIESGAKSIFTNNFIRGAVSDISSQLSEKLFDKQTKRISILANSPEMFMNHMTQTTDSLYDAAPNISQNINSTMVRGVQFLNSKIPRPSTELLLSSKYEPTNSQKDTFNKYYEAVNNPIGILKQIKNGSLSNQAMEALHAVHPTLLNHMQQTVIGIINPKTSKKLNYTTKIALSKFLEQPLDRALLPNSILKVQGTFSLPSYNQSNSKPSRSSQSGLKSLGMAKRAETQTIRKNDTE